MALLGSVLVLVLVGSSVSGTSDLRITAGSGDDVTLRCRDTNINENFLLGWIKPNLQGEETVFLYRNDGILLDQDESFQNRVSLKDPQMKDGDLSVVLENVKINDNGTYECRVIQRNDSQRRWNLISTIGLQVSPPPREEGERGNDDGVKEGDSRGRLGLSTVSSKRKKLQTKVPTSIRILTVIF
ncbi:cell surface A33 antigen-like [Oryzias melastigma]|uniref:cell surface A33 antigen-like n=1 Tax=Oryzias melastigma TaxID=30732 RepID=UPI000CF812E1|nr:cell surface A33 antigen-like [Oryzias melastigma]